MSKRNKRNKLRRSLTALSIVLGIILAVMLAATVYAEFLLGKMNYLDPFATEPSLSQSQIDELLSKLESEDEEDPDFDGPDINEEDVDLGGSRPLIEDSDNVINILLVGADRRSSERARSDSMILCTFNKTQGTISMTSFMRDMYVQIPGYRDNRINAAYPIGGMALLNETLRHNFGIHLDGIVEIDFARFEDLIDMLGGIELELTGAEAEYINKKSDSWLHPGLQRLNGEQALWYSRCRKVGGDGDFGRTNRQRILLGKLLDEYKNKSMLELLGLMDDILPMVTTNMTKSEILTCAKDLFPMLAAAEITTNRIPVDGAYSHARIRGMAVLLPDIDKNIDVLKTILSEYPKGVG